MFVYLKYAVSIGGVKSEKLYAHTYHPDIKI